MKHCEPANSIIELLGGIRPTANAAETSETSVRRWRLPITSGGTGGFIPRKNHAALIKFAKKQGIDLPHGAFLSIREVPVKHGAAA